MHTRQITLFLLPLFALPLSAMAADDQPFVVSDITPTNKTQGVELDPLIQIHVSEKFAAATVNGDSIQLRERGGPPVDINIGGDLGGVITVSVREPLQSGREYELRVNASLKSLSGKSMKPMTVRFRATDEEPAPLRQDIAKFRFTKTRIERRDGICGLALAKDLLFACTWDGRLLRYSLDEHGKLNGEPVILLEHDRRFNAIVVDPVSTGEVTTLWLSHDSQHRLSLGPNDFSGTISRVTVRGDIANLDDVIMGLPTGDHPASGLTFGPDGRLFVSQGALSMLGGKSEQPETPLSAATLAINLNHDLWKKDGPVDVREFQPQTSPRAIQVFATGIREAFDLCWHSSGQLFAGVNMNDTRDATPAREGLPAISVRPAEMMLRIVAGKYYGHPNPSRKEWVLLGGNPTADVDPWEIPELPVGTKPEQNFDPSLLVRNLEQDKGPSADGVCEWTSAGELKGRLLFCFYTATRGIHSYKVGADGTSVSDHQPLVGENDRILRFGAPLDIVHDRRGWLYVADFSAPERGDSGRGGGIWLVKPVVNHRGGRTVFADDFGPASRGKLRRNTVRDPQPVGLGYKTDTPHGFELKNWLVADASGADNRRSFWCVPKRADGTVETYAQQAGRSKNSIAYVTTPVPKDIGRYTIEFRQWCNDNDYIGFVVGASVPALKHDGAEFGYTRQLPGTDTTVDDAYLSGDLGEKKIDGQALRRQWVRHRIIVDGRKVSWFQNDHLMGKREVRGLSPGGHFGIRHRFERGTRYDDVRITTAGASQP